MTRNILTLLAAAALAVCTGARGRPPIETAVDGV